MLPGKRLKLKYLTLHRILHVLPYVSEPIYPYSSFFGMQCVYVLLVPLINFQHSKKEEKMN